MPCNPSLPAACFVGTVGGQMHWATWAWMDTVAAATAWCHPRKPLRMAMQQARRQASVLPFPLHSATHPRLSIFLPSSLWVSKASFYCPVAWPWGHCLLLEGMKSKELFCITISDLHISITPRSVLSSFQGIIYPLMSRCGHCCQEMQEVCTNDASVQLI